MDNKTIEPTPKQAEFITTDKRFACYSGAFGAGKTLSGCMRGLLLSQYPGNLGIIGRSCYDDQTEVLTEKRGWILFKDLLNTDKVAVLKNFQDLIFEYPIN